MPRRSPVLPALPVLPVLPVLLALGGLTVISALAAGADAATQQHRALSGEGTVASARIQSRATTMAGSVGLFGGTDAAFQAVTGVTGAQPHKSARLVLPNLTYATAVNPRRGKDGLLCDGTDHIYPVKGLRSLPRISGGGIDGSAYTGEGGPAYTYSCYGVAMHGTVGLATGDSQGLLQLIRDNGRWRIDTRVRSSGLNDAGQPHVPGWIAFPDDSSGATIFDSVAIAPEPMANGKRLAVAIDRSDHTLMVVSGVGTAEPRAVGSLSATALSEVGVADQGTGGLTFLPSSPKRALVTTASGFAVLDLHKPSQPRLKVPTTVGNGSLPASSITVSADGDHLAVAVGDRVYGYRNLLAAVTKGRSFKEQTSFRINAADEVSDVAYTRNDTLVTLAGNPLSVTDWFLSLVKKVPLGHHRIRASIATTNPDNSTGTLSVWPVP